MNVDTWQYFSITKPASVFGETKELMKYEIVLLYIKMKRYPLCACVILTASPDCVNLQNILDPCSGSGCYGDVWTKGQKYFSTNQKLSPQNIYTLQSSSPFSKSTEQAISEIHER